MSDNGTKMMAANTETISRFGPSGSLMNENTNLEMANDINISSKKIIFFMQLY